MRPQTSVSTTLQAVASGFGPSWATLFIAAPALKGEANKAHLVRSLAEHDAIFGASAPYSELRDQLEAFFYEGGKQAYVARVVHLPVLATGPVTDLAVVTSKSPGVFYNDYDMVVSAVSGTGPTSTATWALKDVNGDTLEYIVGATVAAAAAYDWKEVDVTLGAASTTIIAGTYGLSGGSDGFASIDAGDYATALGLFVAELGTGIVVAPMLDATAALTMLEAHGLAFNRSWLVHSTDTAVAATIIAQGLAARAAGQHVGGILAGKVKLPGLATNPTSMRTVSPVGATAGLIARSDDKGSPARSAAGIVNGAFRYVAEATQSFSTADLDALHDAGVNVIRTVRGVLCLYDFITPAQQVGVGSEWLNLGHVRAHAAVLAELDQIAELYQFELLSGNKTFSDFHASITAMLMGFHAGRTLYGESPSDAFSVNVAGVNNEATIAARELHAAVAVKYSETNYWTNIDVTKVPIAGIV